jgi:cysteine-rich repeat protein
MTDPVKVGTVADVPSGEMLLVDVNGAEDVFVSDASIPSPVCGNGMLETGESCDDGNTTSGDGCEATCTPTLCVGGVAIGGAKLVVRHVQHESARRRRLGSSGSS